MFGVNKMSLPLDTWTSKTLILHILSKEIWILPVSGVIHHSFATIHPYINTHLTHLIDCLVKCDELTVNMIGGSSHFDGYTPARPRPMKTLITLMPSQTNCMFVKKKGKCLDIKIITHSHKTTVQSRFHWWEIINQIKNGKNLKKIKKK